VSPSGSVGLMFDILRCATFLNGTPVPVRLIEIRTRETANRMLDGLRAKREIGLDRVMDVRYVWKVRAKTPMNAVRRGIGQRNKFEDNLV